MNPILTFAIVAITSLLPIALTAQDTLRVEICQGDNYNGYDATGIYLDTLESTSGMDSVRVLDLYVHSIETGMTEQDGSLISEAQGIIYQWQTCFPFYDIAGAHDQSYSVVKSGEYRVMLFDPEYGCEAVSECFQVFIPSGGPSVLGSQLNMAPNPASDFVEIGTLVDGEIDQLSLIDLHGRVVLELNDFRRRNLDVRDIAPGLYVVQASVGGQVLFGKVVVH